MADPLAKWVEEMKDFIRTEDKKPIELTDYHAISAVEIAIDALKDCIDWDPTPHYLYDNSGGEPVLSARELYHKAFREHKEAHS